jgi:hypothetical protein
MRLLHSGACIARVGIVVYASVDAITMVNYDIYVSQRDFLILKGS